MTLHPLHSKRSVHVAVTYWVMLAIATLVLAGGLAAVLVFGRAPVISEFIEDPQFFRRGLVVHVVLSLWGWFLAYAVGLRILVDGKSRGLRSKVAALMASTGVIAMICSAWITGADPLLVNYIPVIDHPVFLVGLAAFFAGVGIELCRLPSLAPPAERSVPAAAAIAWRATAPVAAISVLVFILSWATTPTSLEPNVYYELLFWGVGHTVVVISVLVMLGAWFYLLRDRCGRGPVGPRLALGIVTALILPWLAAPFLVLGTTVSGTYIAGFTRLMQFGIAAPVMVAIAACIGACLRREISIAGRWAFFVSAALTVVGFSLGAMIRGSDTMIPAHYHASLGAITVALMALTYALLHLRGWAPKQQWWRRISTIQPLLFGIGQLVFAAGFAISGHFGMGRKTYGADQVIDSTGAFVGLATMGVGGLMAVAGGAGFVALIAIVVKKTINKTGRLK